MIDFYVPGLPGTKGSKRPMGRFDHATGKVKVWTRDMGGDKGKAWAAVVALAAQRAMAGRPPIDGPVVVEITFYLPRPKGHFGKRGLKPAAPPVPIVPPDGDKMLRSTWDALTGVVFGDDKQIVRWPGGKDYADAHHPVGAHVRVRPWQPPELPLLSICHCDAEQIARGHVESCPLGVPRL